MNIRGVGKFCGARNHYADGNICRSLPTPSAKA
jgi:hypothetical protein